MNAFDVERGEEGFVVNAVLFKQQKTCFQILCTCLSYTRHSAGEVTILQLRQLKSVMGDVGLLVKRLALGSNASQVERKALEYLRRSNAILGYNALGKVFDNTYIYLTKLIVLI